MTINGTTMLAGVAGWPISHSRSPLVHNYWFARYGINGAYLPLPIAPENFRTAITGLKAAGFVGINCTVPHKEAALALVTALDPSAQAVGAANTLAFGKDGVVTAYNTDSGGFLAALRQGAPDWRPNAGPAVVLGAGGAARAVITALIGAGVETIRVINRSSDRAYALQAHCGQDLNICTWARAHECFEDAALLVNTTTLGMQGQPRLEVPLDTLPPGAVVNDLVYAPLETELLHGAKARGLIAVDGLGMLLHQAAAAFKIWFGVAPEIDAALRAHVLAA